LRRSVRLQNAKALRRKYSLRPGLHHPTRRHIQFLKCLKLLLYTVLGSWALSPAGYVGRFGSQLDSGRQSLSERINGNFEAGMVLLRLLPGRVPIAILIESPIRQHTGNRETELLQVPKRPTSGCFTRLPNGQNCALPACGFLRPLWLLRTVEKEGWKAERPLRGEF
jgi:hypothetical protein